MLRHKANYDNGSSIIDFKKLLFFTKTIIIYVNKAKAKKSTTNKMRGFISIKR